MTGANSAQRSGRLCRSQPPLVRRLLSLAAAILLAAAFRPALAQTERLHIAVAATLPVASGRQQRLPLQVGPAGALPPGCFVRLRGLPATAALSDGHSIAPGAWTVPLTALPTLAVLFPAGATGRSELSITLVSADGSVLAEANATLVITAAPAAPHAEPTSENAALLRRPGPRPERAPPRRAAPSMDPEARERALRLVRKGDAQLAEGGVAQARLLYERAADAGLALGAMAMAATYDAVELRRLGVLGLRPDREIARRWYERARQLGAPEAAQRLQRLGTN